MTTAWTCAWLWRGVAACVTPLTLCAIHVAARMHSVRGSRKAAMLSCGYRNLWRAQVSTPDRHWSYDEFVMPLLCVCGTRVFIGAAIVTADKGACSMWRSTATVPHTQACRGPAL